MNQDIQHAYKKPGDLYAELDVLANQLDELTKQMAAYEQDPNIARMEINDLHNYSDASFPEVPSQAAASDILNMIQTTPRPTEKEKASKIASIKSSRRTVCLEDYESMLEGEKIKQKNRLGQVVTLS